MLKRPSSRRKSTSAQIVLNLVPIIDTMVTLIGFLLFTTSFLAIVSIESPFPQTSQKLQEEKLKEKPLQLTVSVRENDTEVWSPFNRIPSKTIPNISSGQPDIKQIHDALITVKQRFPEETKVVFVPFAGASYDVVISVMDSLRTLDPTDPPFYKKNVATGIEEPVKLLFPEVIFGNLLGEG